MPAPPIPLILPLFVAALLAALHRLLPRWLTWALAIATSAGVSLVALSMLVNTRFDPYVYWVGSWRPRTHALALCLFVDTNSAMLVLLGAVLATASLVFSICYFENIGRFYPALVLVFVAAASGVAETGDVVTLFVFFEVIFAVAYALCHHQFEGPAPHRAARSILFSNGIAALFLFSGIALLYSRTGTFNLAQAGRFLPHGNDSLVPAAFALIACAFLIKAGIVPFHFWLVRAHAAAPAPVCALFSGVMVLLGLYALARFHWTVFSGFLGSHNTDVRNLLAAFAVCTALFGALLSYAQRHLKRLLAFATISQMGVVMLGIALLAPEALAGASIFAIGRGLLIGGLFLAAGILLHRTATLDEIELTARPRHLRWTGGLFFLGAAGLAGFPPFGTFWGETMLDGSAATLGYRLIPLVLFVSGALVSASVFRFAGRAFLRWGPDPAEFAASAPHRSERWETRTARRFTPAAMYVPALALILLGGAMGLSHRLTGAAEQSALTLQDSHGYASRILDQLVPYPATVRDIPANPSDLLLGVGTAVAGALLAAVTLLSAHARRLFRAFRRVPARMIPNYLTWLIAGAAAFGVAALTLLR